MVCIFVFIFVLSLDLSVRQGLTLCKNHCEHTLNSLGRLQNVLSCVKTRRDDLVDSASSLSKIPSASMPSWSRNTSSTGKSYVLVTSSRANVCRLIRNERFLVTNKTRHRKYLSAGSVRMLLKKSSRNTLSNLGLCLMRH